MNVVSPLPQEKFCSTEICLLVVSRHAMAFKLKVESLETCFMNLIRLNIQFIIFIALLNSTYVIIK